MILCKDILQYSDYIVCSLNTLDAPTLTTQKLGSRIAGDSGPQNADPTATPVDIG